MEKISIDVVVNILKKIRPEVDFINEKQLLNDGKIDSFDLICIIRDIEKRYSISIDFNKISKNDFKSAEDIYRLICRIKDRKG